MQAGLSPAEQATFTRVLHKPINFTFNCSSDQKRPACEAAVQITQLYSLPNNTAPTTVGIFSVMRPPSFSKVRKPSWVGSAEGSYDPDMHL
jgi:hypothetical protein